MTASATEHSLFFLKKLFEVCPSCSYLNKLEILRQSQQHCFHSKLSAFLWFPQCLCCKILKLSVPSTYFYLRGINRFRFLNSFLGVLGIEITLKYFWKDHRTYCVVSSVLDFRQYNLRLSPEGHCLISCQHYI